MDPTQGPRQYSYTEQYLQPSLVILKYTSIVSFKNSNVYI